MTPETRAPGPDFVRMVFCHRCYRTYSYRQFRALETVAAAEAAGESEIRRCAGCSDAVSALLAGDIDGKPAYANTMWAYPTAPHPCENGDWCAEGPSPHTGECFDAVEVASHNVGDCTKDCGLCAIQEQAREAEARWAEELAWRETEEARTSR